MEEKIVEVLLKINPKIAFYTGNNLIEDGLLDSFSVIELVELLEETFNIEIDAQYVIESNFISKENIIAFMKQLID